PVSPPEHAPVPAPDIRPLRARGHVLGNCHDQDAVLLAAVRDDVHRGAALAARARQASRDGSGRVRLVGLEDAMSERGEGPCTAAGWGRGTTKATRGGPAPRSAAD